MAEWSIPKTFKNLKGFLGLKEYYYMFLKNYGEIGVPLTSLLKKEAFSSTQDATKAFEKLKEAMCSTQVLAT
jgi:hypothetical protein